MLLWQNSEFFDGENVHIVTSIGHAQDMRKIIHNPFILIHETQQKAIDITSFELTSAKGK